MAEAFQTSEIYNTHKWLKQTFARQVDNSAKFVNQQLRSCNVDVGASEPMFLFCSDDGNNLQEHVCKTSGLLHFLFHYGEICRDEKMFQSILDRMKTIGGSIMEFSLHLQQQFVFVKLQSASGTNVSGGLLIRGFLQAIQNRRRSLPHVWFSDVQCWVAPSPLPPHLWNPPLFLPGSSGNQGTILEVGYLEDHPRTLIRG